MKSTVLNVRFTLTEPLLGTCSGNPEVHEEFVIGKALEDGTITDVQAQEEMAAHPRPGVEHIEKASTLFARIGDVPCLWDYQIKGFVKEALGILVEMGDVAISKWLFKRVVDNAVFVSPRQIPLALPPGGLVTTLQRPLRADTMQGERICLARSEMVPAGTTFECQIELLGSTNAKATSSKLTEEVLLDCLKFGSRKGLGQWRNGGYGRFTFEIVKNA